MTPNPPLNGEITKPACHSGALSRAYCLQHGCLTKAIRAPLRPHIAEACLSVRGWICAERGREGRTREMERERAVDLMLTGQFQAVGPDGTVWPLIPQAILQVDICLHLQKNTHKYTKICIWSVKDLIIQANAFSFISNLPTFKLNL